MLAEPFHTMTCACGHRGYHRADAVRAQRELARRQVQTRLKLCTTSVLWHVIEETKQ